MAKQSVEKVLDRIMNYPHKEKGCSYICGPHLEPCVMVRLHDGDCECKECHPLTKKLESTVKDAVECLESFGVGLAAEAKSTATAPLRTRQCEIRSTAIFTVLDALGQYRKALEGFGVTFADNGLIRMIPRSSKDDSQEN